MTKKLEELFNLEESTTVEPAIPVIEESKDHGYDLRYSNKFQLDTTKGNIVTQDAWDKDK